MNTMMEPSSHHSPASDLQSRQQSQIPKEEDKRTPSLAPKPQVRVLNRVPRACNACRKQKMRCEGAENPPCRRCRHTGIECLFEKPNKEASLTGEAGLERIRALEASVDDLKRGQGSIQSILSDLVATLRSQGRVPSTYSPLSLGHTSVPGPTGASSPIVRSGATPSNTSQAGVYSIHQPPPSASTNSDSTLPPIMSPVNTTTAGGVMYSQGRPPAGTYSQAQSQAQPGSAYSISVSNTLPPISAIHTRNPDSSTRYTHFTHQASSPRQKRANHRYPDSNVTSAHSSSDDEDDGMGASGLVAPLEVLRGLADAAVAHKENGEMGSEPASSRQRSPETGTRPRPPKRRKTDHPPPAAVLDVVTKGIISETTARHLFKIYYDGCNTFLPVFDQRMDTFESLHAHSPFAVNAICMVGSRVMKGGGPQSDLFKKCLEEVHHISSATLFQPISRPEQVQAMVLVSGWSDSGGWLSGGHAVRMALELSMHRAWPKLKKRIRQQKASTESEDMALLIDARTWFTLYLMEHQMSYGTGRPAILKDDDTIDKCDLILEHPLANEDDMRLVSMVELMAARERWQNAMGPLDQPVTEDTFDIASRAREEFKGWYDRWDQRFAKKYPDRGGSFYRQSLEIQYLIAELFHNATALRNIRSLLDVPTIPERQWDIIRRSFEVALKFLDLCLGSVNYRENLQNAVHYTHASAAFAGSFLIRLARLFPTECDPQRIKGDVEKLADVLNNIASAHRFAVSLRLQIHGGKRRSSTGALPQFSHISGRREPSQLSLNSPTSGTGQSFTGYRPNSQSTATTPTAVNHISPFGQQQHNQLAPHQQQNTHPIHPGHPQIITQQLQPQQLQQQHNQMMMQQQQQQQFNMYLPQSLDNVSLEQLWRGFETTQNGGMVPMWLSDQALGDQSLGQFGMESYMIPVQYDAAQNVQLMHWS